MKEYGRMAIQLHVYLSSALNGGEFCTSLSSLFIAEEQVSGTH